MTSSHSRYYYPPANNGTATVDGGAADPLKGVTVVVGNLKTLLRARGTAAAPVTDISLDNLKFTQAEPTFLDAYEVPSGGDWSIHRGGAVFFEGVKGMTIDRCLFERVGGNGLFLSNYAVNTVVQNSEFAWIGDSAFARDTPPISLFLSSANRIRAMRGCYGGAVSPLPPPPSNHQQE